MSESPTGATSGSNAERFSQENFPELNADQRETLSKGRLPGLIKLQAITLMIASLALVLAIVAIIN